MNTALAMETDEGVLFKLNSFEMLPLWVGRPLLLVGRLVLTCERTRDSSIVIGLDDSSHSHVHSSDAYERPN